MSRTSERIDPTQLGWLGHAEPSDPPTGLFPALFACSKTCVENFGNSRPVAACDLASSESPHDIASCVCTAARHDTELVACMREECDADEVQGKFEDTGESSTIWMSLATGAHPCVIMPRN